MNRSIIYLFCLLLAVGIPAAKALYPALGGEFGVSLNTSYGYNSNINANSGEQGDDILTLTPSIIFRREKGLISGETGAGVSIIRYGRTGENSTAIVPSAAAPGFSFQNQAGNNSADPFAYLRLSGINNPDNPLSFDFNFNFRTTTASNDLVGQLTRSYNFNVALGTEYQLSQKFGFGFDPFFQYQIFDTAGFNDPLSTGFFIDGIYFYSEKLSFDAGYRFRYEQTNGTPRFESFDHTFFVGAAGTFLPKVTGNVQIGFTYRDNVEPPQESDLPFPYVSAGVGWAYSEKTSFNLFSLVDLSQSPGNQGIEIYSVGTGVDHTFTDKWSAGATLSYAHRKFTGNGPTRDDNQVTFGANINYDINSWAYAAISGTVSANESNIGTFGYNQFTVFGRFGASF